MTHLLNHPITRQSCAFVGVERGYVCLALSCTVTPATQWFPVEAIERANPVHTCQEPPTPLIIALPADMIGQTPITSGKHKRPTIAGAILADCAHVRVIKPISLWHESMAA